MPELPEVETIRRDLEKKVLACRIIAVQVLREKAVRSSELSLEKHLPQTRFTAIERVGKLLMFKIENGSYMLVHLKMTGQLIYVKNNNIIAGGHSFPALNSHLPDKHTQIIITFDDGGVLFFNDMRRFGYVRLVKPETKEKIAATYGIEPLAKNFTYREFARVLAKRKTVLKALLLNQAHIAGIGNIYADEICHLSGVLPDRKTQTLSEEEIKKLHKASQVIMRKAIKHRGTTFNNYVDSSGNKGNFVRFLKVYERAGERCITCKKTVISKKSVAGRGTHFCTTCQR